MSADNQQERLLDPWYVTGWFDGEGCFSVSVHPHPGSKYGWLIDPVVQTYQHKDSFIILNRIKKFFSCGSIRPKGENSNVLTFSVESRRSIKEKIIPHFIQYPLQSRKAEDFLLFRKIVEAMERKEHHDIDMFVHLVNLAFCMNPHGKNRKYRLNDVIKDLKESSETTRQTRRT